MQNTDYYFISCVAAATDDTLTVFSPPPPPCRKAETESGKLATVTPPPHFFIHSALVGVMRTMQEVVSDRKLFHSALLKYTETSQPPSQPPTPELVSLGTL